MDEAGQRRTRDPRFRLDEVGVLTIRKIVCFHEQTTWSL